MFCWGFAPPAPPSTHNKQTTPAPKYRIVLFLHSRQAPHWYCWLQKKGDNIKFHETPANFPRPTTGTRGPGACRGAGLESLGLSWAAAACELETCNWQLPEGAPLSPPAQIHIKVGMQARCLSAMDLFQKRTMDPPSPPHEHPGASRGPACQVPLIQKKSTLHMQPSHNKADKDSKRDGCLILMPNSTVGCPTKAGAAYPQQGGQPERHRGMVGQLMVSVRGARTDTQPT